MLLIFVFIYQDMAAAGGSNFLSPASTGGQIAQMLPGNLKGTWERFKESPSVLTPQEASELIEFLRTHPDLPEGAMGVYDSLLSISGLRREDVRPHRFRKDLREKIEELMKEEGYEQGRINQVLLYRGLSWTAGESIYTDPDVRIFEITARALNIILKKTGDEQITPSQIKAVISYHELVHRMLRRNRKVLREISAGFDKHLGRNKERLFRCFSNQYGEYSDPYKLIEELIASYYTEKMLVNPLEVLEGGRLITIDEIDTQIAGIIELYAGEEIGRIDLKKFRYNNVLGQVIEKREEKKRPRAKTKEAPAEAPGISDELILRTAREEYGIFGRISKRLGIDNNALNNLLEKMGLLDRIREIRRERLLELARECNWSRTKMAESLGVEKQWLINLLHRIGINGDILKEKGFARAMDGLVPVNPAEIDVGMEVVIDRKGLGRVVGFQTRNEPDDIVLVEFEGGKPPVPILRTYLAVFGMVKPDIPQSPPTHEPAVLWRLAEKHLRAGEKRFWVRAAEEAGIEKGELIKIVIKYLAEKNEYDLDKTARELGIELLSLLNYIINYDLKDLKEKARARGLYPVRRSLPQGPLPPLEQIERKMQEEFEKGDIKKEKPKSAIKRLCRELGIPDTDDRIVPELRRLFHTYRFFELLKEIRRNIERRTKGITAPEEIKRIQREEIGILRPRRLHDEHQYLHKVLNEYYGRYSEFFRRNEERINKELGFRIRYKGDILKGNYQEDIMDWINGKTGEIPDPSYLYFNKQGLCGIIKNKDNYLSIRLHDLGSKVCWISFAEDNEGKDKYIFVSEEEDTNPLYKVQIVQDGKVLAKKWGGAEINLEPVVFAKNEQDIWEKAAMPGSEIIAEMIRNNKFTDRDYKPEPFIVKAKRLQDNINRIDFGMVRYPDNFQQRIRIFGTILRADCGYKVNFRFSERQKRWFGFVHELIGRREADEAVMAFTGREREKDGRVVLCQIRGGELARVSEELGVLLDPTVKPQAKEAEKAEVKPIPQDDLDFIEQRKKEAKKSRKDIGVVAGEIWWAKIEGADARPIFWSVRRIDWAREEVVFYTKKKGVRKVAFSDLPNVLIRRVYTREEAEEKRRAVSRMLREKRREEERMEEQDRVDTEEEITDEDLTKERDDEIIFTRSNSRRSERPVEELHEYKGFQVGDEIYNIGDWVCLEGKSEFGTGKIIAFYPPPKDLITIRFPGKGDMSFVWTLVKDEIRKPSDREIGEAETKEGKAQKRYSIDDLSLRDIWILELGGRRGPWVVIKIDHASRFVAFRKKGRVGKAIRIGFIDLPEILIELVAKGSSRPSGLRLRSTYSAEGKDVLKTGHGEFKVGDKVILADEPEKGVGVIRDIQLARNEIEIYFSALGSERLKISIVRDKLRRYIEPKKGAGRGTLKTVVGWLVFIGACMLTARLLPETWPVFLLAAGMAGWSNGNPEEQQEILNCVLENGPVPEPHEGFVKNGKLFLIDHKKLIITLSHLKGYEGRVWVSYQREEDNLYAFVWEQKETMEKSSGAGGYINKYYLIKGGEVMAQWFEGRPTGRYPRKAKALGIRMKGSRKKDSERKKEKRFKMRLGVNYRDLSAGDWVEFISGEPAEFGRGIVIKIDNEEGIIIIYFPGLSRNERRKTFFLEHINRLLKKTDAGEITEEIASLMQAETDNTQTIPPPVQDEDEFSERIASPAITDDRTIKAYNRTKVRKAIIKELSSDGITIVIKDKSLTLAEIEKGRHNKYLLEVITNDPESEDAVKACNALKLLKNKERVIDILFKLDPGSWDPSIAKRDGLLLDVLEFLGIINNKVLQGLRAFSVYGNETIREKAMALYHRFKGLFISGSPMIMDTGERIVQPDVHELIQNGNIDFEGAVSIKVDTLPQKTISLKERYFNPALIIASLVLPFFYPMLLMTTIFFFHLNHLLVDAQISGKISYKDIINIGKYIKISSLWDFLGILIGYIKRDSNALGPISDWKYFRIRSSIYLYFIIILTILFLALRFVLLLWPIIFILGVSTVFEFINLEKPEIDIGKRITIEGKDAFSRALADAWGIYSQKAGRIDTKARDEFISLVLDNDDNRDAPIIIAKVKGLPQPARFFVDAYKLDRRTKEILRRKGIYYKRGLSVIGLDSEFVDAVMANMSEETARGYLWLLAERVFGHELAEKTPHTLEHEIRIQRFNRRMNRIMLRDGSIYYPVYDVTHKDMGGEEWQDRFKTRRHFKWLRGMGPAGKYVREAMEQIDLPDPATDEPYVMPQLRISRERFQEIYVELAERIHKIYPYWIIYPEDMLYHTVVSNGPEYGWYGLICAMRKDGKVDKDDFMIIAGMGEIVDFAPPELKTLLTVELAKDYLKKDMFIEIENRLRKVGYGNEAGEIIDRLMQIVKTMAWNDNTYEVKLRFPEDYYFISELESILGYEREEIFNEIIVRYFEKKIDEIKISERDEHRFNGESLKALVKRFLRGDLPPDLQGYIEGRLRGKLTVYQGIQLFKEQVRMFKESGLPRLPEVEKVLDKWDELDRDSSAVGFWA